ncbi:MAG: hypothetical protein HYX68_11435 [Planctomycetes bacterium]|nr:hypothetical protein [Planctomycetota bacterium]
MHEDLFAQAEMLARVDIRRPKQVNLRRAVSSTYYGVFHYLVDGSCRCVFGTQHGPSVYRHALGRAFVHTTMKLACVSFAGGTLRDAVIKGLPRDTKGKYFVQAPIRLIGQAFAELQEKRHLAEYDRNERFKRNEILPLIEQAKKAVTGFSDLPDSDDKRFFWRACGPGKN